MQDSPLGLDMWLIAMWLIVLGKNGISSCEIAPDFGIRQKGSIRARTRFTDCLLFYRTIANQFKICSMNRTTLVQVSVVSVSMK
jgi:hypothetical protein